MCYSSIVSICEKHILFRCWRLLFTTSFLIIERRKAFLLFAVWIVCIAKIFPLSRHSSFSSFLTSYFDSKSSSRKCRNQKNREQTEKNRRWILSIAEKSFKIYSDGIKNWNLQNLRIELHFIFYDDFHRSIGLRALRRCILTLYKMMVE